MFAQHVGAVAGYLSPIHEGKQQRGEHEHQGEDYESRRPNPSERRNHAREEPVRIEKPEAKVMALSQLLAGGQNHLRPLTFEQPNLVELSQKLFDRCN